MQVTLQRIAELESRIAKLDNRLDMIDRSYYNYLDERRELAEELERLKCTISKQTAEDE